MAISSLDVLCCRIIIGDADPDNLMAINTPITLTEVKEIEINESYKKLIGTAKVVFPKGILFSRALYLELPHRRQGCITVTTEVMQDGIIIEKRTSHNTIDASTFKIGQRISISLGYNGVLKKMFEGYITGYNS